MPDTWDKIKKLYESSNLLGIAKLNKNSTIIDCNETFAKFFGTDKVEITGLSIIADLTRKEDIDNTVKRFEQMVRNEGKLCEASKRLMTVYGKPIVLNFVAVYLKDTEAIIDIVWKVDSPLETDAIARIQQTLSLLQAQQEAIKNIGVNINMKDGTNIGGDYVGHNKTTNDTSSIKYIVLALVAVCLSLAYGMYYFATMSTNTQPQPPQITTPE